MAQDDEAELVTKTGFKVSIGYDEKEERTFLSLYISYNQFEGEDAFVYLEPDEHRWISEQMQRFDPTSVTTSNLPKTLE